MRIAARGFALTETPTSNNEPETPPDGAAEESEETVAPPGGRRGRPLGSTANRAKQAVGRGRNAAIGLGGTIQETIRNSLHDPRNYVVMVRVSKDALQKLDELVECGLLSSRSTAAAYLISEGVRARKDLYERIAEQSEVIREAREKLQRLLDD